MYSWEMELDLDNIDFRFDRELDLNFRKAKEDDELNHKNIIYDAFGDDLGEDALMETLREIHLYKYLSH